MMTSASCSTTASIQSHTDTNGFLDRVKDEFVLDEEEDLEEDTVGEDDSEEEEPTPPVEETQEVRRDRVYKQMLAWGADEELAQMAAELE